MFRNQNHYEKRKEQSFTTGLVVKRNLLSNTEII